SEWERLITMTDAARGLWAKNYSRLNADQPGMLGGIVARAPAQVVRLALIYALLDKEKQIDEVHLKAGLAVWEYCEESASIIFSGLLGNEMADAILYSLRATKAAGMTRTEIYHMFSGHKTTAQISSALALLQQYELVREGKRPTAGRPVEV